MGVFHDRLLEIKGMKESIERTEKINVNMQKQAHTVTYTDR